jgi:hypothetical protein
VLPSVFVGAQVTQSKFEGVRLKTWGAVDPTMQMLAEKWIEEVVIRREFAGLNMNEFSTELMLGYKWLVGAESWVDVLLMLSEKLSNSI